MQEDKNRLLARCGGLVLLPLQPQGGKQPEADDPVPNSHVAFFYLTDHLVDHRKGVHMMLVMGFTKLG